jgi:hypothetical protein
MEMVMEMEMETKITSLVFVTFSGDVLMTLENNSKKIYWRSVLDKISTEEWYKTYKRWRFVFEIKNLEPHDIIESNDKMIKIMCVKIVEPHITFELPDGEFLVSVPFEICKSWHDRQVYLLGACFEAHKKLRELGTDGYGTDRTKIHLLIDTYFCNGLENPRPGGGEHAYFFRDKNGKKLDIYDILKDPKDDNLTIVAVPKKVYCSNYCKTKFHGPMRIGERREVLNETVSMCPACGFLHCISCDNCGNHLIGTSECNASRNILNQAYCDQNCCTKFHGPLRVGEQRKVFHETVSLCSVCGFLHCRSCGMYKDHMIGTLDCASRDM